MATLNIRVPDEQKEQVEKAAERGNYPNPSEWIRDAIRDKLKQETTLYPKEVERILEVWEEQEKDELETVPSEEVWKELGISE